MSTSTLHTHPPNEEEELIKGQKNGRVRALYRHVASGRMGGPNIMNLVIELKLAVELRKLAKHS